MTWPANKPHNDKPAWLVGLIKVWRLASQGCEVNGLLDAVEEHRAAIESKIEK
jgi:hypothetical protein